MISIVMIDGGKCHERKNVEIDDGTSVKNFLVQNCVDVKDPTLILFHTSPAVYQYVTDLDKTFLQNGFRNGDWLCLAHKAMPAGWPGHRFAYWR